MTFWAKVLIIVMLVLSIAFASVSGILFAKRANYRGLLHKANEQAAKEQKKLNDEIAGLEGDLEDQRKTFAETENALRNRDIELAQMTQRAEELNDQLGEMARDKDAQLNANNILTINNEKLVADALHWRNSYDKMLVDRDTYRENLMAERAKNAELETERTNLTNERNDLKVELAEKNKYINETDEILAELASRGIEPRTVINDMRIIPSIKTQVAKVEMEEGIIVLNAGTKDGVKKNYEFTIFRGDKFVATVNVFHVQERFAAAQIVRRAADIQLGDSAWTRLP